MTKIRCPRGLCNTPQDLCGPWFLSDEINSSLKLSLFLHSAQLGDKTMTHSYKEKKKEHNTYYPVSSPDRLNMETVNL